MTTTKMLDMTNKIQKSTPLKRIDNPLTVKGWAGGYKAATARESGT